MAGTSEDPLEEAPTETPNGDAEAARKAIADVRKSVDEFCAKAASQSPSARPRGSFREKRAPRKEEKPAPDDGSKAAELKERLMESEAKNEKLRKKNGELGNDLSKARSRIESLAGQVESLSKENESLKKRSKELLDKPKAAEEAKEKCALLEMENANLRSVLEKLRADYSSLEAELESSRRDAEAQGSASQARISELEDAVRKLKSGIPLSEKAGTVERTSASQLSSPLFDCGRYDVRIARNGSYMTFRPDVEGKVPCSGGELSIPALEGMVAFDGPRRYDAYHFNGGLKVVLRRSLSERLSQDAPSV